MYQKIEETFWTDPKVSNLPPYEKLLFIYLITNSHVHYSGLYQISRATMQDETSLTLDALNKSLTSLIDNRLIRYDNDKKTVWVINMAKHQVQQGNKINLIKGFAKQFNKLHNSILIKDFLIYYATLIDGILNPSEWDTDTIPESVALISSIKQNHKAVKKICAKKETATSSLQDSFNVFYTAYPKHKAKEPALKAWKKLNPDDSLLQTILHAIENAKETDSWKKDNGTYIPLPATWLNGKRWEDELNIAKPVTQNILPTTPDDLLTFLEYINPITDASFCCIAPGFENVVANAEKNIGRLSADKELRTVNQWEKFILELKPS